MTRSVPRMAQRRHIVLLSIASVLMLVSPALAQVPATPSSPPTPAYQDPWSDPDIAAPRMDDGVLRRPGVSNQPATASTGATTPSILQSSWIRTAASLGGVVALILFLGWGYRWLAGASGALPLGLRGRQANMIEVLSKTSIAPRQTLCLVRVGTRLVLVGATHDSLRALDVVDDPDAVAQLLGLAARQRPDSLSGEFNNFLTHESAAFDAAVSDDEEDTSAQMPRNYNDPLSSLGQKLANTVKRLRQVAAQS